MCNKVQCCLTTKLNDYTFRILLFDDIEHILDIKRLEIEFIRCIEIGTYSLRVIVRTLKGQYPSLGVYLSFESPNYKVTLGDFRTKDEALAIYNALKNAYPTAYIIKESINYPR